MGQGAPAHLQSAQVGLMVWSPLAGGLLSGKFHGDNAAERSGRRADFDFPPVDKDRAAAVIAAMRPIAARHGVSVAQIALAWLLHQPVVTSIIVGAKREEQLVDNIAATKVNLTVDDLAALNACSLLPPEYPGWMFKMQHSYRADLLDKPDRGA
jgi:aryl-alcohol dehydrogenase-like predicted oxidoreductase